MFLLFHDGEQLLLFHFIHRKKILQTEIEIIDQLWT